MAKYTGPKDKLSRRYGEILSGMPTFEIARRPYRAGQHGQRKAKHSECGLLLREKQKLRLSYNILEKQFYRYYLKAVRRKGPTGENLIKSLETRLDSMVYRLGFASTIAGARQLVNHGHILVNGYKVDIASYAVQVGDKISIREKSRKVPQVVEAMKDHVQVISYVKREKNAFEGVLEAEPAREEIPVNVNERMIVEYYSR